MMRQAQGFRHAAPDLWHCLPPNPPLTMTTRLPLALVALLALSACSSVGPTDEPLPTRDQLLADFGRQTRDPGTGYVRERGGNARGSYDVTALYNTRNEDISLRSFYVSLRPADGSSGWTGLESLGLRASEIRVGDDLDVSAFVRTGGGVGRLYVTAVDGEAISGVFAVDAQVTNQLYGKPSRISGTFTAHRDSTL